MFSKCRACLSLSDNMKFISEDDPDGRLLITMFTAISNFEWINNEKIASYLCSECEINLEIAYKFQKKCRETHQIITKLLENDDLLRLVDHEPSDISGEIVEMQVNDEKKEIKRKPRKLIVRTQKFSEETVYQVIEDYRYKQNSNLKCLECDYGVSTLRSLSIHMSQAHKEMRDNWCCSCNEMYENVYEHKQKHKNLVEACPFCNKQIKKKYFIDHLRMHSGIQPFQCQYCKRGFLTNSSLRYHYSSNQCSKKENNTQIVDEILLRAENGLDIKKEEENDGTNMSGFLHNFCEQCNKKVRSLPDHIRKTHSDAESPKMYICNICDQQYKTNSSLQLHLRLHRGDAPYQCSYCGKAHNSTGQLRDHLRTHTGERPFICNYCGKGFAQSGALKTHLKIHTGRPEICKICQKRFCRPSELKLHLRKHSGEKPFLCTDCGKTFVQKSHLTEHMKTHSDLRPHKCTTCDKAFKQKSLLRSHLQIHSGNKHYKCTMCSYACFKAYRLQQHMKQHNVEMKNTEKSHSCPICYRGFTSQNMLNAHVSSAHNAIV